MYCDSISISRGEKYLRNVRTVGRGEAGVGGDVGAVLGADDGVLVLVGLAGGRGEGVGEPVRGADEGRFGVEVLCAGLVVVVGWWER